MEKKFLYSTGKKGRKPNCEYYTDGNEFDEAHRFTKTEVRDLANLEVGETLKVTDEEFASDFIRIKRFE